VCKQESKTEGGGIKYTYGTSSCSINLINILDKPEYIAIRDRVFSILSRQDFRLNQLMNIENKNVRDTSLLLWHKRFVDLIKDLPEVVRTHTLCVETAIYRKLLRKSKEIKKNANNTD
jgi:hypothetical protein